MAYKKNGRKFNGDGGNLMLHYNGDDGNYRTRNYSERPCDLDPTDFIITQGNRKPNAQ